MPYEAQFSETVNIRGHQDDVIDAYLSRPFGAGPHPGVVVIHHMPAWDEAHKEITRKFAHHGYMAMCPNLHFREGKGDPYANSESIRAAGGMPDARTMGDVQGAINYLRGLPVSNGKVGVIGFCSGGRQAYLSGCTLNGIDAVVDCYGGGVVAAEMQISARMPVPPIELTKDLSCPLLGLFGNEDKRPSPKAVDEIEAELKKFGKIYEFRRYDNDGHGIFAVDRSSYRQEAAMEGWKEIFRWYEKYLR